MNAVNAKQFDIALDKHQDIDLNADTGSLDTVSGKRELAQKISNLLNINKGEVKWNPTLGLNQYQILINDGNPSLIQQQVSRYLHDVFGAAFQSCHIESVNADRTHRKERINLAVTMNTNDGVITVSPDFLIGGE